MANSSTCTSINTLTLIAEVSKDSNSTAPKNACADRLNAKAKLLLKVCDFSLLFAAATVEERLKKRGLNSTADEQ